METVQELQKMSKEEIKLQEKKNNNIKVYKKYRVFSWDLLFYYAIIYLFLTIEKKITPAQVLQFDAFYILFKFITQIPSTLIIQKIGKRKSLILANFVLAIHVLIIMFSTNFEMLVFSQVLCAFSFVIKATCETDMLYDSLKHEEKRGVKFAKIDGKSTSLYYYIDAISAAISGFLFVINPYIPMALCFAISLVTFFMSAKFEEIHEEKGKMQIKKEINNIEVSFKNILKSERLKSLLIFNGIFVALIKILQNLRNTVLIEIGMPEQYFGIIFAFLGIVTGIGARNQGRIHKRYRNRTLAFLSLPVAVSGLITGLVLFCNFNYTITTIIILLLFTIQYVVKGPYYVLIKQYFNNFTNSEKRVRIATANNVFENGIASILIFLASWILEIAQIKFTLIILGCIFIITFVLLLDKMKTRVGLKPEEYSKKEIL